jgi:imidazolonepropionase-like amidohydrolase
MRRQLHAAVAAALMLCACGQQGQDKTPRAPYSSTYSPPAAETVLIQHATVLTGNGSRLDDGDVLLQDHKVNQVGKGIAIPPGAVVVDAQNRWVTPGIIDPHSHLGVYASPAVWAMSDGNEATSPTTPNVWSEHSVWPQDPGFEQARAGGVTSMMILPGSANLIGGRGTLLKNVPATTYQEMKFPGAPQVLKMACGENPKRVYGSQHKFPSTWMGDVAGYREAFAKATEYKAKRDAAKKGKDKAPDRDIGMDTLADVLDGKILVEMHCYRADQMATMLDVAQEFKFKISAFHHAVEAYKIGPLLKQADTCAVMWADWWGFKLEAYDGIRENVAMVDAAGACATVHSDDPIGIQRLNQEAGKAMAAGIRAGLDIPHERAIRWITSNPAKALGVADRVGSLEPGKDGDVVVWSGDPFSVYTQADLVYIDGVLRYDRAHPPAQPDSDFKLGILGSDEEMP